MTELRRYAAARGWKAAEYLDDGGTGADERRKALDAVVQDVRRRRIDVVVCWRLDRLGRGLRHLVALLNQFHALGVAFVSLGQGIDCTTPAGRFQLHVLTALAEFERARIAERVKDSSASLDAGGGEAARGVDDYGEALAQRATMMVTDIPIILFTAVLL